MAEWTGGVRPRRRSQPAELDNKSTRRMMPDLPDAPGAVQSPQIPGMTPDKSTIPGHGVAVVPKPSLGKRRPIAQYGTAEEIVAIYRPSGEGGAWIPDDFNGARSPLEELRKVDPLLTQPERPAPGYETLRALTWLEERSAVLEAGVETLSLAAGLPMNAAGVSLADLAAIPTEATLLGMAGAAAGSITHGQYSSGTWAGGPDALPEVERAGSLTGLGVPAESLERAVDALGYHGEVGAAPATRDDWTKAAPPPSDFAGAAGDVAAAPDSGMGIRAGGSFLSGEAATMPLMPEGAVGEEVGRAELGGLPTAAPMPRDVVPGGVRDGGVLGGAAVDAADMGGDLQAGFSTGGVAREGGEGGWLSQEQQIEGIVSGHHGHGHGHRAAGGAAVDAADMGGDLQAGFTTGGAAHEGGSGTGWLEQEEAIAGIVAGSGAGAVGGAVVLEGWDGPVPDGAIVYAGGNGQCPAEFPIKGNLPSRFYHLPGDFAYVVTVPEFCFNHEHAAFAAGFTRAPQRPEAGSAAGGDGGAHGGAHGGLHGLRAIAEAGGEVPVPSGAVRAGDKSCPGDHPIKGNLQSGYYHRPQDPSYNVTIPEFCFATEHEAQTAGFTIAGNAKKD